MGATAPVGSLVLTEQIDAEDVRPGTIIVLNRGRDAEGVLHRVIERDDSAGSSVVRTQGDANDVPDVDPYVLPERVLSPVLVVPQLGRPIAAATTPEGAFGLIVVPATLLLAHRLVVLWSTPPTARRGAVAPAA
jgi:signal peptidase